MTAGRGIGRLPRAGLALIGGLHLLLGGPAAFAPRWFFDTFPGAGHSWTAAYPPFNEHLMTDVGAAFLALGALLLIAAFLGDRLVATVVLVGELVFNAAHLRFHLFDHGTLAGADFLASTTSLTAGVLLPGALLAATVRSRA